MVIGTVADMFGCRGQVDDRVPAIRHEGHGLALLPARVFQDRVQASFGLCVMALHKTQIAARRSRGIDLPTVTSKCVWPSSRERI